MPMSPRTLSSSARASPWTPKASSLRRSSSAVPPDSGLGTRVRRAKQGDGGGKDHRFRPFLPPCCMGCFELIWEFPISSISSFRARGRRLRAILEGYTDTIDFPVYFFGLFVCDRASRPPAFHLETLVGPTRGQISKLILELSCVLTFTSINQDNRTEMRTRNQE